MWIRRKVQQGTQTGQKIGYPTLNFNVRDFAKSHQSGVYICDIRITDKLYKGALYFGPRLSYPGKVLEMYVIDFNKKIYGQFIKFRVIKKIRSAKPFKHLDDLKKQIKKDVALI